jgi:hypothetical protein
MAVPVLYFMANRRAEVSTPDAVEHEKYVVTA